MNTGLTLRIDADATTLSDDEGRTWSSQSAAIVARARRLASELAADALLTGGATAAAMAVAAEARSTRPRTSPGSRPAVDVRSDQVSIPIGAMDTGASQALTSVLSMRRSTREFASLSLRELAPVLLRSARVTDIPAEDQAPARYRSHLPSPGALHPHEVWIAAHGVSDLPDGLWRFDPFTCALGSLNASGSSIERAVSRVGIAGGFPSRAPATLFLVADFSAIDREYFAGATLVWRDAGVLGLALHLCAEDLGLASCIVGTSGAIVQLAADSTIQDTLAVAIGGRRLTCASPA